MPVSIPPELFSLNECAQAGLSPEAVAAAEDVLMQADIPPETKALTLIVGVAPDSGLYVHRRTLSTRQLQDPHFWAKRYSQRFEYGGTLDRDALKYVAEQLWGPHIEVLEFACTDTGVPMLI